VITELVEHMGPEAVEAARKRFEGVERLTADDIADAIEYIVTCPWRVAVNEIMVRPTEQEW
jgi:NADP-dependent 3-hydroxy acid dehydrogenase YdfG